MTTPKDYGNVRHVTKDPGEQPRRAAPGEVAGTRNDHDTYDTDPLVAEACCEWLKDHLALGWPTPTPAVDATAFPGAPLRHFTILEPCAGSGPFVRAARKVWPTSKIGAVDIRGECRDACLAAGADGFWHRGAMTLEPGTVARADLIISNPPFKLADQLARKFLAEMKPGASLAFLLACTFWGSADRWAEPIEGKSPGGLFVAHPIPIAAPTIVPRPDFGEKSGPKFECMLYTWHKPVDPDDSWGARPLTMMAPPIRWTRPKKPRKARKKGEEAGIEIPTVTVDSSSSALFEE